MFYVNSIYDERVQKKIPLHFGHEGWEKLRLVQVYLNKKENAQAEPRAFEMAPGKQSKQISTRLPDKVCSTHLLITVTDHVIVYDQCSLYTKDLCTSQLQTECVLLPSLVTFSGLAWLYITIFFSRKKRHIWQKNTFIQLTTLRCGKCVQISRQNFVIYMQFNKIHKVF